MSDEETNARIEELRGKRRAREQSDLAKILSQKEGRRLLWRILSMSGVFALSFSGMDHALTDFNEGKRSVGNLLLRDIPPEIELIMKKEASSDKLLQTQELEEIQNGQ